ncbi:MAG: transglutaminase domain-containing protein [Clostridiales bacterium]|nr:transglutaminase domain-containing protein [Clostridiales bacterium]MBR6487961.1 transglutaminase domain-containing protein [Clostridiales bacterium]
MKKAARKKTKTKSVFRIVRICFAVLFCLVAIAAASLAAVRDFYTKPVITDVTIEAGSTFSIEDFFQTMPEDARFITDVSGIDTKIPAVYGLKVGFDKYFDQEVRLTIQDTTAPTGKAVKQEFFTIDPFPAVEKCVTDLYDLNGIAEVKFRDGIPDVSAGGDFTVPVVVTDPYQNSTVIEVPMHVTKDSTPPEISGLKDNQMVRSGDEIDFRDGVTVTDDYDPEPVLTIDASKFNYNKPGKYTVYYKATDRSGNVTEKQITLEVWQSSASDLKTKEAYKYADQILKKIKKGKNDSEYAKNIYKWVCRNIVYLGRAGHPTFEKAALAGFKDRKGNCWVMCCCYKVLLDRANIPNLIVTRANSKVTRSNHYWNLIYVDKGWYHCDCTPLYPFFMKIDSQLDEFHTFESKLYPKRATKKAKSTKGYYAKRAN